MHTTYVKWLSLCAGILLMGGVAYAAEELKIATEGAYPPFNFMDASGKLQGLDVDIANAVCAKMDVKCTIVAQDWDGIIPGLQSGKYDAIVASMSITPEREKEIAFSDKYYSSKLSILTKNDSGIANASEKSLAGKTIGAQSSTPQAELAEKLYGKHSASVKLYPSQDEADMDLSNGRIDAIVADKFYLTSWLKDNGKGCCKIAGDLPEGRSDIAVGMRKDDAELKQRINTALGEIMKDGTYKKIVSKFFDFEIY
ncbi:amino acid ABC transporter [Brucellaceae bacterium VT-16-1752]|nr:amino acid ABC transporter [Brucellaceae bacterium VT-16-1752]